MKIGILCTGDEILTGKTVNTNYSHIAARLVELGFDVHWGATVGDDRRSLLQAMKLASSSSDVVIVNGGLGPTLDDLTQEMAAHTAGVGFVLHREWLERIERWYRARGRGMPDNNRKQALLPEGSELIDNPIGTACGFALDIGSARFFFTPGVPGELFRMLDEQIIPRLQAMRGGSLLTRVKRFHSFGIGESRADGMLAEAARMAARSDVRLGFQSHYPQLETKLAVRSESGPDAETILGPIENEVRARLGNFIVCEDNDTIEGGICRMLQESGECVSVVEMHTAGRINGRLLCAAGHPEVVRTGMASMAVEEILGFFDLPSPDMASPADAGRIASRACERNASTHGLAVLTEPYADEAGGRGIDVHIGISGNGAVVRRRSRLPGRPDWTRIGAVELGLDCLRRFLSGLPVDERIDFEQH
ncbi:MAG: hypothetical protein F4Z15_10690 [Gammaproteobacteria bacterium]|nr:hypothetical protein [Gammaproteobacteria bacterium]MYD75452.1 hypothetical protein [Gammaproteobacteria bacterium]MYJ51163.1 hypothetical protein [Gammaproteobacteria bacterium]